MAWSDEQRAILRLACTDGVPAALALSLIEKVGSAARLFSTPPARLISEEGLAQRVVRKLHDSQGEQKMADELAILDRYAGEIRPIFWGDAAYPKELAACVDAPLVLFLRGTLPQAPMVSVVGTRRMTPYTEEVLHYLFSQWAEHCPDLVVVSGLAYGVDACAHRLALEHGLRTVAVVAHGHHTLYPSLHRSLAADICQKGGGVLTEYTYGTQPHPHRFVERNRIVAGLSMATLVVESADRGGALITANLAFDYSRSVFAVPGRLFDETSMGCNFLIAQNKASILTHPLRLLEEAGIYSPPLQAVPIPFPSQPPTSDPLERLLQEVDTISLEDLSLRLALPLPTLTAQLFDLELDDKVMQLPGGRYRWKHK